MATNNTTTVFAAMILIEPACVAEGLPPPPAPRALALRQTPTPAMI
jgi:hypothetical protein